MRGRARWSSGGEKKQPKLLEVVRLFGGCERDAQVFRQRRCQSKRRGDGLKEVVTLEDGQVEVAPSSKLEVYPSGVRRLKKKDK